MTLFKKKPTNTVTPPAPVIGTAGSLREFVYLDEVSVYSLVSAPDMPPPVTMSESADTTAGEALSANIEGGAPLLVKATVAGELSSSRTRGLQVQRQFNIQSQFARLHSTYQPTFLLTAKSPETRGKNVGSLQVALESLQESQHAIPASSLTRGALAELRVALRAHPTFDITVLLRVITGLLEKHPGLLQVQDDTGIRDAIEGGEFLSELMDNLVPIEGRSTTHEIVTDEQGDLWVAHMAALRSAWTGPIESQPLQVVGVTETKSFWKDTRRILHAEAEFDVLGRVSRTGLQDEWTPVKMVDTFRRVLPKATESLVTAVDDLSGFTEESQQVPDVASLLVIAGQKLNDDLASHHNVSTLPLSGATLIALVNEHGSLERELAALSKVADDFYNHYVDLERAEDEIGMRRQTAWRDARDSADQLPDPRRTEQAEPKAPVLELEFIAMYW